MAVVTRGRPVSGRNDKQVKIDAEVARLSSLVAAFRKVSMAEYLSETLRPIVQRDLEAEMKRYADSPPAAKSKKSKE